MKRSPDARRWETLKSRKRNGGSLRRGRPPGSGRVAPLPAALALLRAPPRSAHPRRGSAHPAPRSAASGAAAWLVQGRHLAALPLRSPPSVPGGAGSAGGPAAPCPAEEPRPATCGKNGGERQ